MGGSGALGVAIIGASFMGRAHSNAWRNVAAFHGDVPPVRMQVMAGRDPERTASAARQLGWAMSSTDWRAVIERDDIAIVDVCTPGHLHHEIALAALRAGKHVLVEKPLCNTLAKADELVEAAAAAAADGVRSMVGFNYRRVPALALARELIAAGRLGRIREIRAAYLQDWLVDAASPMTWRLRKEQAGSGVLGDLGSHVVDQVRFLTGEDVAWASGHLRTFVTERPGESGPEPVTVDDAAWATLALTSGTMVGVEVSRMATGRKNGLSIEVFGSEGALSFDLERLNELSVDDGGGARRVVVTEESDPYLSAWWPPGHVLGWDATFTNQAADFLTAIAEGCDPSPSFADGAAVQRVLDAIERSDARDLARVDLAEDPMTTKGRLS